MRIAESVLLTCWPPAPQARKVSTRRSAGLISISMRLVHLGVDEHAGERGVAAGVGVERRLAHQAVHAGLGAQRAVGVVAAHLERRALDAGDFARRFFQHFDGEAVALAEAQVHALEHRGPVLRLGAAGAGLDVEEAVVRDPSGWRTCGGTPDPPPPSRSSPRPRRPRRAWRRRPRRAPSRTARDCRATPARRARGCRRLASSALRSLPSSWARLASVHRAGSSESRITSSRRLRLASKSKIPPQLGGALIQVVQRVFHGVDAFCFHDLVAPTRRYGAKNKQL